jgi:hypothetical protein
MMDKPKRRVRAGQPPADLELWEVDLNDLDEDKPPLSDAIAGFAVLVIILIVGACAALVVRVI